MNFRDGIKKKLQSGRDRAISKDEVLEKIKLFLEDFSVRMRFCQTDATLCTTLGYETHLFLNGMVKANEIESIKDVRTMIVSDDTSPTDYLQLFVYFYYESHDLVIMKYELKE